jgi:glycosyltransferase involved in cell wall biosynthesis
VLPIRNDKVFVQGVGLPPTSVSGAAPPAPPLRVAVIGNVAPNKGADTIIAVVQQLASEKKVHFTIAGDVQDGFRQPLEQLRRPNVVLHGPYKPEDIAEILQGHHVALFASPWPETFSVTLSEAFRAGVVPIAPAIGAFAERIRDGKNGLHVRGDVGSFMRALLSLLDDPVMFHKLRQGVLATKILTLAEESQGIASLYEELAEQYHLPGVAADASPDQDALSPISVVAVGPPPNPVAAWTTSTWRKALNLYRTQGAKALVRRAWQRATGRRSA